MLQISRRLTQRYIVDAFANIDQARLEFLRHNQNRFWADVYNGLSDALHTDDVDIEALGRRIILPSSYSGGDHHMAQLDQNSMAIYRRLGKAALFITMTMDPKWPHLLKVLPRGTNAMDNPSLSARVFNLKRKALTKVLKSCFGVMKGISWTVEYQKRGLPHTHILLFLDADIRHHDPAVIDELISAEFPEPAIDPTGELMEIVKTQMVHGPCGQYGMQAPCMKPDKYGVVRCSKGFPMRHQPFTTVPDDNFPLLRRREGLYSFQRRVKGTLVDITNQWIVLYSPFLSLRFGCHINVLPSSTVMAVKYIHKYVYKGEDRIIHHSIGRGTEAFHLRSVIPNEISRYAGRFKGRIPDVLMRQQKIEISWPKNIEQQGTEKQLFTCDAA